MQKTHDIRIQRALDKGFDGGTGLAPGRGLGFSVHDCDSIAAYATGSRVSYTLTIEI
jgi:hypothetical protein